MPVLLQIKSNTNLKALGKALRGSSAEMRKPIFAAIQTATKPLHAEIATSARQTLPRAGGLGELVADLKIVTQAQLSGRNVGVRIIASRSKAQHQAARRRAVARRTGRKRAPRGTRVRAGLIDLNALNRGRGKHPTYGHRPWVIQTMRPGFFDRPMKSIVAVRARNEILRAVDATLAKIAAAGRKAA